MASVTVIDGVLPEVIAITLPPKRIGSHDSGQSD